NATYSASANDIAVQSYFFDIKLTNLSPRYRIPPEVLLVMSSPNHPTSDIEDVMHAYDTIMPPQVPIPPLIIMPPSPMLSLIFNPQEFFFLEEISPPKDDETPVESSILVSLSSSVGSSSPVRSITTPPDYPFDESIFAELDNSLWIIP
nr:hypothetical protein [Tanacetum cinerariifolium]